MNLIEKLKYNIRYSGLDECDRFKAELYIFDKYSFQRRDLPKNYVDSYDDQQKWLQSLGTKPKSASEVDIEHKKWVWDHFSDVSKLASFNGIYEKQRKLFFELKQKYPEAFQAKCIECLVDIKDPTYFGFIKLNDQEDKLRKEQTEITYTREIVNNPSRASYVEEFLRFKHIRLDNHDYVVKHLSDLEIYINRTVKVRKEFEQKILLHPKRSKYVEQYKKVFGANPPTDKDILNDISKLDRYIEEQEKKERRKAGEELKKMYPDGFDAYWKDKRYNLNEALEHAEEIKALDASEKRRKNKRSQREGECREAYKELERLYPCGLCEFEKEHGADIVNAVEHASDIVALDAQVKRNLEESRLREIERQRRKREEEARILNEAKSIANNNRRGFPHVFPELDPNTLTIEDAKTIVERKDEIVDYETLPGRLAQAVSDWDTSKLGIPYYFFYWYYPNKYDDSITESSFNAKMMIFDFKNGRLNLVPSNIVKQKLYNTFKSDCRSLVLVGIPASTREKNRNRYSNFMSSVRSGIGITTSMQYVTINSEGQAAHLTEGHNTTMNYSIDKDYFNGKNVVVFDDVVTRGTSMKRMINELRNAGANVVCAISLGRTVNGPEPLKHPWTNDY